MDFIGKVTTLFFIVFVFIVMAFGLLLVTLLPFLCVFAIFYYAYYAITIGTGLDKALLSFIAIAVLTLILQYQSNK